MTQLEVFKFIAHVLLSRAEQAGMTLISDFTVAECRGKAAGWCRYFTLERRAELKFNFQMLNDHPHEWEDTIIHELAHALAPLNHGWNIRPHGPEWAATARALGGTGNRTHFMPTAKYKARRTRQYVYVVNGAEVMLGATRHSRLQSGAMTYRHRTAGAILPEHFTGRSKLA
jgi:predicted SprT family Zn-dependent metalloprotease